MTTSAPKTGLCSARTYRGVLVVSVAPSIEARTLVLGTAHRQAVTLYECANSDEAYALIDSALALAGLPMRQCGDGGPVQCNGAGGARAVESSDVITLTA